MTDWKRFKIPHPEFTRSLCRVEHDEVNNVILLRPSWWVRLTGRPIDVGENEASSWWHRLKEWRKTK